MNTEHERLSWTRFQAELIKRTMRRLRANPDFARRGVSDLVFGLALPVFRAVGVGWFAVNCFSATTYGGRLAILFTRRKLLRSSDLR